MIPNPWQAARIAGSFIERHQNGSGGFKAPDRVYLSGFEADKDDIDRAETVFRDKVKRDAIRFHLETDERLNYEIDKSFEVFVSRNEGALHGEHASPIQQSLFDPVYESNFNGLEKDFALYLDKSNAIYWWHKIAARQQYYLQGWRRQRVYPDFVA